MANLSRRKFLSRVSMTAAASVLLPTVGYSASKLFTQHTNPGSFVIAPTAHGKIKGLRVDGVNCFKGVAYGGTVSGDRRFRRPAPIEAWTGVKDALELGAPTMQPPRRGEPAPAEDCLFLNVWTPANDHKKRPVMVYTHGGGYVNGSGGAAGQDGANLARNFDVVVVETNHRLGLLGFLYLDEIAGEDYTGSGNMGVLDITAALKWVHENIAEFGGDPDNVMIFGESGGGGKTSCLYAMPETAPYFNKASIESGPGVRMLTKDLAAETTERVLKELNITKQNWRKLLDVTPNQLLEIQNKFTFIPPFQENINMPEMIGFGPVVDGVTLPNHPFDPTAPDISKDKPLITGWNEDEYAFFIMTRGEGDLTKISFDDLPAKLEPEFGKDTATIIETYRRSMPDASAPQILMAVKSITLMGLGSVEIAEKKANQKGAPVYLYNFGYKSDMKIPGTDYPMGTPHAMDISFKFNNEVPPKEGDKPFWSLAGNNPDKYIASHKMAELWTNFAKTGVPSAKEVPEWPAYNFKTRPTMRIDTKCEVINDRFSKELDMWRSINKLKTL
ncbi:carboxylesterase/lipase family protein [Plebeiibacterium sediminum]|uniref:Carboxylic ester hydrolase n=1 Tax=Plebeiibacterium sediminum TaxID=2992112 RepID=A0AAE3SFD7_9BACT|nr:carboxylesterase family protein [Plebeiobacterium sediminum]MCW3787318.1 carboxylesterase family protein [Plebeiobacterium sediminum]